MHVARAVVHCGGRVVVGRAGRTAAMHADEARAIGEGGRRDLVRVRVRVGVRVRFRVRVRGLGLGLILELELIRLGFAVPCHPMKKLHPNI